MVYNFLRLIFKLALKVFFKEKRVINKEAVPTDGPLIVIANHPSTFMDPIILASLLKQKVHFIAKGTLFNTKFKNWLMRKVMFAIPVYRKQDNPADSAKNDAIFDQCFQFMEEKGTLIIFPEGTSINERKLRELKTGTARIALGAEARNNFKLGLKILPVGINYSDAPSFRSDVWINVEEPISLVEYQANYIADPRRAVKKLTDDMRKSLEKNLIIADDKQEDLFIKNIETMYKNELISQLELDPKLHSFKLLKGIEQAVNHFEQTEASWFANLQKQVTEYFNNLTQYQLDDRFLARDKKEKRSIFTDSLMSVFFLLLGLPFYIYAYLTNYIPYILPSKIARKLNKFDSAQAPLKMLSGIFTFSLYYGLLTGLFHHFIARGDWWWTLLFMASLPLAGFFAMYYYQRTRNLKSHLRLLGQFYKKPAEIGTLLQQRQEIIKNLDWAKDQFFTAK